MLWLDGYGVKLGARQGALHVKSREGETSVPVSDVDLVVVASGGVSVTSRALRLLLGAGIELVVLDSRGMPVGLLYMSYTTRTPATRRAQYEALRDGRALHIIWEIVRAKLWNQACTLRALYRGESILREAEGEILAVLARLEEEAEAITGLEEARERARSLEAQGARAYWGAIARVLPEELGFDGRDQEGGDPVNAALNYGYGILYSLAFQALALAGLDPYAGFLHADRSGKPVLAFDYVELFRAQLVDLPVIRLFRRGWRPRIIEGLLTHESRRRIAEAVLGRARERGERIGRAIRSSALELARSLRDGAPWRAWRGCRL